MHMLPFHLAFMLHFLLGFGSPVNPNCAPKAGDCAISVGPTNPDDGDPDEPLPQTMATICTGKWVDNEARIKTMARMMDWCYCGNTLNPNGLEYAGFSVYEDEVDPQERNPSRTWVCSKNKQEPCDHIEDWYNAIGNVTQECGHGRTGYFYDAVRQMAWGFETWHEGTYCSIVWLT